MVNIVSTENAKFVEGDINVWDFVAERNPELIKSMRIVKSGMANKIFARKTTAKIIDNETAKKFIDRCHVKQYTPAKFNFGLFHGDKMVMVLSMSPSRFHIDYDMEIIRLCSEHNCVVVGGFTKLLNFAVSTLGTNSIHTYSENMLGDGTVYAKNGFIYLGETVRGYFWKKGDVILSRFQTQKHKLKRLLPHLSDEFISTNTETQIMISEGFRKVLDFGNKSWGINEIQKSYSHHYVYKITRPEIDDGFYIGVHSTNNLDDGYMGSGVIISRSLKKYGVDKHVKTILKSCASRKEAFELESNMVSLDVLSNPNCLNIVRGGKSSLNFNTRGMVSIHKPGEFFYTLVPQEQVQQYISDGYVLGKSENFKNTKKLQKDGSVKVFSNVDIETALEDGWTVPVLATKTGLIELEKDGIVKCFDEETAFTAITSDGWSLKRKQLKSAPDQVIRLAKRLGMRVPSTKLGDGYVNPPKPKNKRGASTGKFSIKKNGVKRLVDRDEAIRLVKNEGWELGAASCWRLASEQSKQLGIELGYDVIGNQKTIHK